MTNVDIRESGWIVLVYRVPTDPARNRVAIWRELKRIGAIYLQQCVCVMPRFPALIEAMEAVRARVEGMGGEAIILDVPQLRSGDDEKLVRACQEQRDKEYGEIVEECQTRFVKEVEFEHFRQNYTYEEAEEIRQDLDKIRRWFAVVVTRDWFAASRKAEVEGWIDHCEDLLAGFEEVVYQHSADGQSMPGPNDQKVDLMPGIDLPTLRPSSPGNDT